MRDFCQKLEETSGGTPANAYARRRAAELHERVAAHEKRRELETFLEIWAEVLRHVRTPKEGQTRKLYRP